MDVKDTLISSSCSGEFEVNREEFVFEIFGASILLLPSSGNHRPSELLTWTQRCSVEYNEELW